MSDRASKTYLTIGILGEILILVGFLLLTPSDRSNIAWLNWAIVSIIFGVNYFSAKTFFPPTEGFSARIPAIGVRIVTCLIYTILSIVWIFVGYSEELSFKVQLLGHLVLAFIALIGFVVANKASEHATQVEEAESMQAAILEAAVQEFNLICSGFDKDAKKGTAEGNLLKLKEEVRFISPVNDEQARQIEEQMLAIIRQIGGLLDSSRGANNSENGTLNAYVDRLGTLIKQRKTFRM